jgi:membrane-associated protease RseP (regulator of RpoE activity)
LIVTSSVSLVSILVVAVGLAQVVHELGHYAAARAAGLRVSQVSIGIGPALLSFRSRDTQFVVRLLPFMAFTQLVAPSTTDERTRFLCFRSSFTCAGALANFGFAALLLVVCAIVKGQNAMGLLIDATASLDAYVVQLGSALKGTPSHTRPPLEHTPLAVIQLFAALSVLLGTFNILFTLPNCDGEKLVIRALEIWRGQAFDRNEVESVRPWVNGISALLFATVLICGWLLPRH